MTLGGLDALASLGPAAERFDSVRVPLRVARHRAFLDHLEDGVGVLAHVVVRPEIEMGHHRATVALTKDRLHVAFVTDVSIRHVAPPVGGWYITLLDRSVSR